MPYKGGVQLLPETERRPTLTSYTSGNNYFYFGVALGAAIIVIGAALGGYKANLEDKVAKLDGQLEASESQRNKDQEKALIATSKQAAVMGTLLSSKIYWSQAFDYMEKMMQSSVRLTSLTAESSKGIISFKATTNDYASVAHQIAAFVAGTGVKEVNVGSVRSTSQGTVEFDGTLQIDTKVMLNKTTTK